MKNKPAKPDQPAFPQMTKIATKVEYDNSDSMFDDRGVKTVHYDVFHPGLTKREYFAALALQGLVVGRSIDGIVFIPQIAADAVRYSDALIAELEKQK